MDPRNIAIKDYTYSLPEEKIAKYPLPERDASKLLIYKDGAINEDIYCNISEHLPSDSLLIFNDTKVIEARLLFQKVSGGMIEIFCLDPHEEYPDITTAMLQKNNVRWQCLVGGASKWKHGQVLEKIVWLNGIEIELEATIVEKRSDSFIIEFSWSPADLSFAEVLHNAGAIPLPPYIKRAVEENDVKRYQTIYAH
ncbi:MAG: S-adenosylmethionine:tRNA ribosyltransferase-isomerase, partial [Bacteroidota bacterium]